MFELHYGYISQPWHVKEGKVFHNNFLLILKQRTGDGCHFVGAKLLGGGRLLPLTGGGLSDVTPPLLPYRHRAPPLLQRACYFGSREWNIFLSLVDCSLKL